MEFRPILSAMLRNKLGAVLVGLQIAITLAVVANAVFIILQRVDRISQPKGIDSGNLLFVQSYGFGPGYDQRDTVRRDLDLIRTIPGVRSAGSTNGIPMSGGGRSSNFGRTAADVKNGVNVNIYYVDEHGIDAFGIKLLEGRAFTQSEVEFRDNLNSPDIAPTVMITRDVSRAMFGDESSLGKRMYDDQGNAAVVIGVIDNMLNAWVSPENPAHVILFPRIEGGPVARYAVRTEPGQLGSALADIEKKLAAADIPRAITWVRPHKFYVDKAYRGDSRMVWFLGIIVALMVCITALGILGLASFHVNVRTKQIGTRRAVGARKLDIMRYFMLENWLLTTGGIMAGSIMAFAFGHWLSSQYALPRLEPMFVIWGAVMLWVIGQLAVLVPARRAAAIPPAIATRTV